MRLSASSTVPSSTDLPGDISSSTHWPLENVPNPPTARPRPRPNLRAGNRTMSFGPTTLTAMEPVSERPKTAYDDPSLFGRPSRSRAMTTSTASTATPPKFLDSEFALGGTDMENFGNMFEGIGEMERGSELSHNPWEKPPQQKPPPPPISVDPTKEVEPSPYSWTSQNSRDGLMSSPSPPAHRGSFPTLPRKPIPVSKTAVRTESPTRIEPTSSLRTLQPNFQDVPRRMSTPNDGEDSNLLSNTSTPQAMPEIQRSHISATTAQHTSNTPLEAYPNVSRRTNDDFGGKVTHDPDTGSPYRDSFEEDQSLAAQARLAAQLEQPEQPVPLVRPTNKIMTPAQFERYRHERESSQRLNEALKVTESDDEGDDYDDDDETERNQQAQKQREKQEAHLAIYRQQMMKVTGEQHSIEPGRNFSRPNLPSASSSTPNLTSRMSTFSLDPRKSPGAKSSEGEEDEDVPLGILAAHGFPNKNRPPTRLASSQSNSNLRSSAGSVAGESAAGARPNLPVFARHLPQDPYFGASLVNSSNRESLAMGGGSSVRGVPPSGAIPPGMSPTGLHPGGLVGVIAGEERAKAIRRGSPNAHQPGYDPVTGGLPGMPLPPGMSQSPYAGTLPGMPGMPPMLTPGDQAQIQMSQQMTQMMQMQMQWMQQMMQMQNLQPGQQPPPFPSNMPSMNGLPGAAAAVQRPVSLHPHAQPRQSGRTMSSLEPSMAQWDRASRLAPPGQGYAASIAPTERSNVGMAPRYRPVSTIPTVNQNRASTFTSGSFQPWNSAASLLPKEPSNTTIKSVLGTKGTGSDDDDDQAWAEMKRKKDKKKSSWKMRKGNPQGGLQEYYHGGM